MMKAGRGNTMPAQHPAEEAIRILFGPDAAGIRLQSLEENLVKIAYRRRMMESHPDRAAITGKDTVTLHRESQAVNEAYFTLTDLMKKNRLEKSFYYTGPTPLRKFRFSEYLYYRGVISWKHLIESLMWQFRNRPRFGDIAISQAFLSSSMMSRILSCRKPKERIGDACVRLGFLSEYRRQAVMGRQRLFNLPIGRYFLEHGILSHSDIASYLADHQRHNFRCAAGRADNR